MRIAIFASGSGTNAENIAIWFEKTKHHEVTLILTNNAEAGVLARAHNLNIPSLVFNQEQLNNGYVLNVLVQQKIDFVVLAGFLKLVPENIITAYKGRIVNIHPALLPKHGGKGMYGSRVHQAVLDAHETQTGITIHDVTTNYDEGDIIFQTSVAIERGDTIKDIEKKVHALEYRHYPDVIQMCLEQIMPT